MPPNDYQFYNHPYAGAQSIRNHGYNIDKGQDQSHNCQHKQKWVPKPKYIPQTPPMLKAIISLAASMTEEEEISRTLVEVPSTNVKIAFSRIKALKPCYVMI